MLKVGITGGIGSGKSIVCRLFEMLNVPVYYADERAKYLQDHDPALRKEVISAFGQQVYEPEGKLNRKALAAIVFADATKLKKLEAIVHPAVQQDFRDWAAIQPHTPYILKEAALLFESGSYKELDKVIHVHAPLDLRLKRVMQRDRSTPEQVMNRIEKQWPEEKKMKMADFCIINNEEEALIPQVLSLHGGFLPK